MLMEKLYWLDQIKLPDRMLVGEKAFQLSQVGQGVYPVVPGFVVSATVFQQFLETLDSSESLIADLPYSSLHLDVDNSRQLQEVAVRLRQEVLSAVLPVSWVETIYEAARHWDASCVIFRPSLVLPAGVNFKGRRVSGLLESQVCWYESAAMGSALQRTWSQLFRAKSLLYWRRLGIDLQDVSLAVLVQPLRSARASGLLSGSSSGLEIQATWGLEVAIDQGEVLPDFYQVPGDGNVVRRLGNKMLAYRLHRDDGVQVDTPLGVATDNNCLQAYLLDVELQQEYALADEYLQQLINLGSRMVGELGAFSLKWTLLESADAVQIYLTQFSYTYPLTPSSLQIKGIAAARGCVSGRAYVIVDVEQKLENLPQGAILIAQAISPHWLPVLKQVAGIITEQGGLTSHGAILARELGIPAVVNVVHATVLFQTGEHLFLDGDKGEVYRGHKSRVGEGGNGGVGEVVDSSSSSPVPLSPPVPLPPSSTSPVIATRLLVNLSQSSLVTEVQNLPIDGVGLLRSELMAIAILAGEHPSTWLAQGREEQLRQLWVEQILEFARAFAPRPVFYRSLDLRSHEQPSSNSQLLEQDSLSHTRLPMLGFRGTFSYLQNPALFDLELAALATVQQFGYSNLRLILPFVRTVEEFMFCRNRVWQAGLNRVSQFQLWMMAEVPSVLFLLPEYVKAGVQGISIGTNDLTQLLLGVDRDQGQLAAAFDERHPAVMSAIAQLIRMSKAAGIPCSICGQAPALYPEIIDQLVEWGISAISVEPEAVERTIRAIARAEQKLILEAARQKLGF